MRSEIANRLLEFYVECQFELNEIFCFGCRYPVKTQMKNDRKGLGVEKDKKRNEADKKREDLAASKTTVGVANRVRIMKQNTLTRQEARREEKRNKRWEMDMRRYLSE